MLKDSERAKLVYNHLKNYLEDHKYKQAISAADWQQQFSNIEVSIRFSASKNLLLCSFENMISERSKFISPV